VGIRSAARFTVVVGRGVYKLRQQESQHREKLEAIGHLAGGVAHDFNNLLTVIIGSLEVLKWEMEAGKIAASTLERMEDAAQRAANLTRQLLAFARRQIVAPRIIDLGQQLRDLSWRSQNPTGGWASGVRRQASGVRRQQGRAWILLKAEA
jgi:signal transduction histidine kinase